MPSSQPSATKASDVQPVSPEAPTTPPASDLQRGESYVNLDDFCKTLEYGITFSYDIVCQWDARCSRHGTSTQ
ncbi:hypothetical protein B0H16DRAFT_1715929 [Mycena metata]|uniref:Uncharacterized protein n=1 Tax=Mycena metata TaxID=1033252 RepID=A0AAD7NPY1_9AGAR|nr:hypothetical protein B0H16DRAFT_1715929 [Mycena metata]